MGQPNIVQENFRIGADGTESGHGWYGTLGQDMTIGPGQDLVDNTIFFLRFTLANTGSKISDGFIPYIEVSRNSGAYGSLGGSDPINIAVSSNVADGDDTTDRLGGTGTFDTTNQGVIENTTTGTNEEITNGYRYEVLIVLQIAQENMNNNGDTYDIRIASADGWTDIPRFTVAGLPTAEINQTGYRFTSVDGTLGSPTWQASANTNVTLPRGQAFQLWIEIEESNGANKTDSYELTWQKNGTGGYTTIPGVPYSAPASLPNGIWAVISDFYAHGDSITSNPVNQSAKTFTNGHGIEDTSGDAESNSVSLNNQCTVLCFTLRMPALTTSDENEKNDYFDIQVRYAGGSAIDSTLTARVTIGDSNGHIGGTPAETQGKLGPWIDTNDYIWYIGERNEVDNNVVAEYSPDGGENWYLADEDSGVNDLESADAVQVGNTVHLIVDEGGAVRYIPLYLSDHPTTPSTFGTVDTVVSSKTENDQGCAIAYRSGTTDFVVFYRDGTTSEEIWYKIGTPGSWGSALQLDSTNVNHIGVHVVKGADSDWLHIFYTTEETVPNRIRHRSMDPSDNSLTASEVVYSDAYDGGSGWQWAMTSAIAWMSGSNDKVGIVIYDDSDNYPYFVKITDDGSPSTPVLIDNVAILNDPGAMTSRSPVGKLFADGSDLYFMMADETTGDLWLYTTADEGDNWTGTPIEIQNNKTIQMIIGQVLSWSGSTYLSYVYADRYGGYTDWVYFDTYDITGALTQSVNQVTENDTCQSITPIKTIYKTISQVTENDTAQTITPAQPIVQTVNQVTENNTPQIITPYKVVTVSQVIENNTPQQISPYKASAIGQVIENNTPQTITPSKNVSVSQVIENNTPQIITPYKVVTIGQVIENDTPQIIQPTSGEHYVTVNQVVENETPQIITPAKVITTSQVTENDTPQTITPAKSVTISQVTENDTPQSIGHYWIVTVSQVIENDTPQPVTVLGATLVNQVVENDTPQSVTPYKTLSVSQVVENESVFTITPYLPQFIAVNQVTENDTSQSITPYKIGTIGQVIENDYVFSIGHTGVTTVNQVTENDTCQPISIYKTLTISQVLEQDTPGTVSVTKIGTISQVVEADNIFSISPKFQVIITQVQENETVFPVSALKAVNVSLVTENDYAQSIYVQSNIFRGEFYTKRYSENLIKRYSEDIDTKEG